ncbi:MAG: enoyl-CoA hydratase-related protein [Planctomycetota bacterium]
MSGVSYTTSGGVAELWLERPESDNAFDGDLIKKMHWALGCAIGDPLARVILLGGRGKNFCAGLDPEWLRATAAHDEAACFEDARAIALLLRTIADSPLPTIARVTGSAIGLGAALVAACDFAVAAKGSVFSFPDVKAGLLPGVVSPHVIEKIGTARARRLFLLGERLDAKRALELGLISHVAKTAAQLDAAVRATIGELLTGGPSAMAATKNLVRSVARDLEDKVKVDAATARLVADRRVSGEGKEGIAAFLEKRKPKWAPQ